MTANNRVTIRVWGDYACFTRPAMKVERVSYTIMTPSAARGVLEANFWEPQTCSVMDRIAIVKRGRRLSFRRNELASRDQKTTGVCDKRRSAIIDIKLRRASRWVTK
jgi:CRISPR-associated protein Cas5d